MPSHHSNTALTNANLLDPKVGTVTGPINIVIESGRIAEVSNTPIGVCESVFDVNGATLMPGLCDAHVHVIAGTASFPDLLRWSPMYTTARASEILLGMLHRGFTTVRDCGGADYGLAKAIEEGLSLIHI